MIDNIPGLGHYTSYIGQELNDLKLRLAAETAKQGCSGDEKINHVVTQTGDYTWKHSLVDSKTGKVISSETTNGFGF